MTQSIFLSGQSAAILQGCTDPALVGDLPSAIAGLVADPVRLQLVQQALSGNDAADMISPDMAAIAVSREGEIGGAYAELFDVLGVEPERLLAA